MVYKYFYLLLVWNNTHEYKSKEQGVNVLLLWKPSSAFRRSGNSTAHPVFMTNLLDSKNLPNISVYQASEKCISAMIGYSSSGYPALSTGLQNKMF